MEAKKETSEESIDTVTHGSVQKETVICSKCGRLMRHPHEWVKGENSMIICAMCYQEILFPNIDDHSMELFDYSRG